MVAEREEKPNKKSKCLTYYQGRLMVSISKASPTFGFRLSILTRGFREISGNQMMPKLPLLNLKCEDQEITDKMFIDICVCVRP